MFVIDNAGDLCQRTVAESDTLPSPVMSCGAQFVHYTHRRSYLFIFQINIEWSEASEMSATIVRLLFAVLLTATLAVAQESTYRPSL